MMAQTHRCCICSEPADGFIVMPLGWRDQENNRCYLCETDYKDLYSEFYPELHPIEKDEHE